VPFLTVFTILQADPLRTPGLSGRRVGEIELVTSVLIIPSGFSGYHEFGVTWPVPEEAVRRIFVQKMT
jgi:hypothetical protein